MGDREPIKLDDSSYDTIWERALARLKGRGEWWSHREISDPGITLMEMWAVLCDMQSFYLDQIQESHYRGFLKLLGIRPDNGSCAEVWIQFQNVRQDCILPAGVRMLADTMVFETTEEVELTANRICGFFRGDGGQASDMLLFRKSRLELKKAEMLFSFLLKRPLGAGHKLSLFVLVDETGRRNPPGQGFSPLVRLGWEYWTEEGWRAAEVLRDETLGLFYSGCVCLLTDTPMRAREGRGYEIRCRILEGEHDEMPVLYKISLNAARVIQRDTCCCQEYGVFSRSCLRVELKSYLGKTGLIRVFARQGKELWREITGDCGIGPPIGPGRQKRYVYFNGEAEVKFVCSREGFEEEYGPCSVTGVTGQRIPLPWDNILRDSVELMLPMGGPMGGPMEEEGLYREYKCADPEEVRLENAWHWQDGEGSIVLGDGRHGDIPPASGKGLLLTSLALFQGEKGNVSIGRIRCLERPELFHQITCSNPLAGKGGRGRLQPSAQFAEAADELKKPNRIVTCEDAERLAGEVPGLLVKSTKARWQGGMLVVTIEPKVTLESGYCRQQYKRMAERYLEQYRPAGMGLKIELREE